jgi:ring-1,2-phenylacetyl-CoA epoxidase subunit PaaC
MQRALDTLWSLAFQLFAPVEGEAGPVAASIVPDPLTLRQEWQDRTAAHLTASGLVVAKTPTSFPRSRAEHTPHLAELLAELQQVARSEEFGVAW